MLKGFNFENNGIILKTTTFEITFDFKRVMESVILAKHSIVDIRLEMT
jgi:hypothetical protein